MRMARQKDVLVVGAFCAVFCAVSCAVSPARAALIVSESFNYAAGTTLGGSSGGGGWAGPWQNPSATFSAEGAAPNIPMGLNPVGGSLLVTAADSRSLRPIDCGPGSAAATAGLVESVPTMFGGTQTLIGKPGTTIWLSFIARGHTGSGSSSGSHLYETFDAAGGYASGNKNGEVMFFGRGGGNANYGYERTCGHSIGCPAAIQIGEDYQSTAPYNDGATHWVVHKIDFAQSATTITMWLDPAPAANDPLASTARDLTWVNNGGSMKTWQIYPFHFGWVELESNGTTSDFDEYRIGTTFADVSQSTVVVSYDAGADASAGGGADGGGGGSDDGGAGGSGGANADGGDSTDGEAPTGNPGGCSSSTSGADAGSLPALLASVVVAFLLARRRQKAGVFR